MIRSNATSPLDVDVVIVGCGPVGGLLANLLGQRGLHTLVLERETEIYQLPRAIGMDDEIMRALQAAGLSDAYEKNVVTLKGMDLVRSNGHLIRRFDLREQEPILGHPIMTLFHQPSLEAHIRGGLARFPGTVDLRVGVEVQEFRNGSDFAEVDFIERESGAGQTARARFVIGCDGSRSFVRKAENIELEDLKLHQPWVVVDVIMKRPVENSGFCDQVCNPARPATFVPAPPPRNRWEFMVMPGDSHEELVTETKLQELIRPWASPDDYDIERAVIYTFHALIADRWRAGRALIAGDAAHQMPPFLGQGMCAGMRDAFNLAWKLDAVIRGHAGESLLDTYVSERSPHVRDIIKLAVKIGNIIQSRNRIMAPLLSTLMRISQWLGLEAEIKSMKELPIGPGCFSAAAPPPKKSRCPFPQPRVRAAGDAAAQRLDNLLGPYFTLLARPGFVGNSRDRNHSELLTVFAVVEPNTNGSSSQADTLIDEEGALTAWLNTRRADAVLLRPDRVPFGIYNSSSHSIQVIERDLMDALGSSGSRNVTASHAGNAKRECQGAPTDS